ncbi:MAG TPA: antibiotic biosynthesis monooxygenase [Stellaceae bacterium]
MAATEEEAGMIHVLAIVTAKPGQREAILRELRANIPAVRAERGCIEYGPAIDAEGMGGFQTKLGLDSFVVIEKWESTDALKAHAAAPHMAAHAAKTKDMIASRVIHVLSPA